MEDRADLFLEVLDSIFTSGSLLLGLCMALQLHSSVSLVLAPKMVSICIFIIRLATTALLEEGDNIITLFKLFLRSCQVLMMACLALKMDRVVRIDWFRVFWPLWILASFLTLLGVSFYISAVMKLVAIHKLRSLSLTSGQPNTQKIV